jgi:hypothetical protein
MKRANGRCEYLDVGVRCQETTDLFAHHDRPGVNDIRYGRLLCRRHHRKVDPHAR